MQMRTKNKYEAIERILEETGGIVASGMEWVLVSMSERWSRHNRNRTGSK
jgi:hypothetical protein